MPGEFTRLLAPALNWCATGRDKPTSQDQAANGMIDFLWGIVVFISRAINFALDIAIGYDRMKRLAGQMTGADRIVAVPDDPKAKVEGQGRG